MYADELDTNHTSASSPDADDGAKEPVESGFPHASDHPMMVMVDEETGNIYMRSVEKKGLGYDGDTSWLVKDMHQELKSWATRAARRTL